MTSIAMFVAIALSTLFAVSSALDTSVTCSPNASWMSPDNIG